ncbi:MAG: ABC transporter permease [Ruminococcus sp.]|jgi:multidrug/hemolysin transport system permease protein|nr:ABC transporter permease [Ruminococcus sp.]
MLIKRNILLFFRDKANVFFSLLAVIIIIALYALFLGGVMVDGFAEIPGLSDSAKSKLEVIASGIILSGMVAVTAVTASQGALGVAVADKTGAGKDFLTSPVKRGKTVFSYIIGSSVCSGIMTFIALTLTLGYILILGGTLPTAPRFGMIAVSLILSVLCGNAFVYFLTVFINTPSAFTAFSTVLGTLIGFIMGIYIPIGQLPEGVGWVIKCFPMSHAASMFKIAIISDELKAAFPDENVLAGIYETFGITFTYGSFTSSFWLSAGVLVVFTLIFFGAAVWVDTLKNSKHNSPDK